MKRRLGRLAHLALAVSTLTASAITVAGGRQANADRPPLIPPPVSDARDRAKPVLESPVLDGPVLESPVLDGPVFGSSGPGASDAARLAIALQRFDFGDYQGVVRELEVLVERGARTTLARADRLEVLRAYGIACVMVDRRTAAEGAFLLLLEAAPETRLDPHLVRPEAVEVFDAVRARNRDALWAAYRRGRGRRYAVLNLLPPAGQLQNRDFKKGYALLGVELALLALDITSGVLLTNWEGEHQDFPGHESAAKALRPVNWVSFGGLIGVVLYGIIDGFVVGHRRAVEERMVEKHLRGQVLRPAPRFADRLIFDAGGELGVRF